MLEDTNRIWDGKEGLSQYRARINGIDLNDMKFVFVRDDLWSIACKPEHYLGCYGLWEDKWIAIYAKETPTTHTKQVNLF